MMIMNKCHMLEPTADGAPCSCFARHRDFRANDIQLSDSYESYSYVIFTFSAARGLLRPEQGEHFHSSGLCLQIS